MVIQTNPFACTQTSIQTVSTRNFRQISQLLHGKQINPKYKIFCFDVIALVGKQAMRPGRSAGALCDALWLFPCYFLGLTPVPLWYTPAYLKVLNCYLNIT